MKSYTPQITKQHSATLRRIAWAFGIPMTKVISNSIDLTASMLNADQICSKCEDSTKCSTCYFNNKPMSDFPDKKLLMEKQSFHLITK